MNIFRSLFGKDHQIDESSLLASLEARIRKERELDVGQIVRNENRLSLFDGSLLVKVDGIYLESDAESGIQHLHTHLDFRTFWSVVGLKRG